MNVPRLQIRGLKKSFGSNPVLRGLDFELQPGEIHALVGGNGAGKSTLSKIVVGLERRDEGEIRLDGSEFSPESRQASQSAGVVMVLQELNVLPTLSVAENMFLGELPSRWGLVDRASLERKARAALARVGLPDLAPGTPAGMLGVGHQQLIEIAAGLARDCRVLILDEPTAALSGGEIATFFTLLRKLCAAGTSVLYISHRLEEIARLADRVSVLRDGQLVATLPAQTTPREKLIQLMAGACLPTSAGAEVRPRTGKLALRVSDLKAGNAVRGVSLEVESGEIVGLGGLVGAGRTELLRVIFGADRKTSGRIFLEGDARSFEPASTQDSVARGIAFVPEDRKNHGLFAALAVRENLSIASTPTKKMLPGWVDGAAERLGVSALLERLQVRHSGLEQPVEQLSGGNQQKVVIGRWLQRPVKLWLLDEPTRGVDAAARHGIYELLGTLAKQGSGVLIASSDYEELVQLCDRVLVMANGRITAEFTRDTLNAEAFMTAAFAGDSRGGENDSSER